MVEDSAGDNNTRTARRSAVTMTVVVAVGPGQGESAHFSAYSAYSTVTIQYTACRKSNEKIVYIYIYIYTQNVIIIYRLLLLLWLSNRRCYGRAINRGEEKNDRQPMIII